MLDSILLLAAAAAATAYFLPYVSTALGFTFLRYGASTAPPKAAGDDAEFRQRVAELRDAGFSFAGTVRERAFLLTDRLVKTTDVPKYRSGDGTTYVSVYRLFPGEPLRLAATCYAANGSRVVTAMPGAELKFDSDGGVRNELPPGTVEELLDSHSETVNGFSKKHRTSIVAVTLDELAAREQASDASELKEIGVGQAWVVAGIGWGLPAAFLFGALAVTAGWPTARAAGVAGLIAAAVYPVFAWVLFPKFVALAETCGADGPAAGREVTTASDRW